MHRGRRGIIFGHTLSLIRPSAGFTDPDEICGLEASAAPAQSPHAGKDTVLVAEDSDFFRSQIRRLMEEEGYMVLDAPDGQVAWELLLQHKEEVRLVLTDIEMPNVNGLELTQRIRSDPALAGLPIIAVTTLADEEDVARGRAAGVNHYQIKLDKGHLLECIRQSLGEVRPRGGEDPRNG